MAAGFAYAGLAAYEIISGFQQAEMVRANAELSQEINTFNADLAQIDAYEAEKAGYSQVARYEGVVEQTVGSQRVALAAQGVDVSFGTAAEIQEDTKVRGFLNQQDIMAEANARALGFKNEARSRRLQGYLSAVGAEVSASATRNAGIIGAAQTGIQYGSKSGSFSGYGDREPSQYQDFRTTNWENMG